MARGKCRPLTLRMLYAQRLVKPQVASAHGIPRKDLFGITWKSTAIQFPLAPPVMDAGKDVQLSILALSDPGSESAIP